MKYFTLEECIYSAEARQRGIDNSPNATQKEHIVETVEQLLDPLREAWTRHCKTKGLEDPQICISSGFRSLRLNAAVGGSATSAHCHGYAFDLVPSNLQMAEFKSFCRDFLVSCGNFDQMISESELENGTPAWIHVGYRNAQGKQRRQLLSMRGGCYYPMS